MVKQADFLLRAVETLSNGSRYYEFPIPGVRQGGSGFNRGMPMLASGKVIELTSIGMNNIINNRFSVKFSGTEVIRFVVTDTAINFESRGLYGAETAKEIFGREVTADYVISVVIFGLKNCFDAKISEYEKFKEEACGLIYE